MHAYDAGGRSDDALSTYIWFAAECSLFDFEAQ